MANRPNPRNSFEDISSYTSKQAYRKNRKKRKRTGLKVCLTVFFVLLIVVGALLVYASVATSGLKTTEISRSDADLGIGEDTFSQSGITNIALFGVDCRTDETVYTGRSDAIMVLTVDTNHNKIKLTSLMRDARVYIGEKCGYDSGYDKLNHAYSYGGPELAIQVINENYGLDIRDYITVNFAGMAKIVDAFGGVDVEVTEAEIYQINKYVLLLAKENPDSISGEVRTYDGAAGRVHLDGNQAVSYSRIRAIGNDNQRVERQQIVLSALLRKVGSLSPLEYPNVFSQLAPLCETSLSLEKILTMAPIVFGGFSIERLSIPSDVEGYSSDYYEGGAWMWDYNTATAAAHIHAFIYGEG